MTDWKSRFEELKVRIEFPDAPDSTIWRDAINVVDGIMNKLIHNNLLISPESKIIIKCKATEYQQKHFKEKFIFRFQSLIGGRQSQIIPNKLKPELGILERYSNSGGPFPERLPIEHNNFTHVGLFYHEMRRSFYVKIWDINRGYYYSVHGMPKSWWDIYTEYLSSPEWNAIRNTIQQRDDNTCVLCGSTFMLHVHHITYKNVGHEDLEDLILVCKECHEEIHRRKL